MNVLSVSILGTRGIPAKHGGFETFAERLAIYLAEKGWSVTVYCQESGDGTNCEDEWNGIRRVRVPVRKKGPVGTVVFDLKSIFHSLGRADVILTLGYNTAIFCTLFRIKRITNIINMDGIEWRRKKWGAVAKLWFWLNDWAGCWLGNHLIADHPHIKKHLRTRVCEDKITMIPYGANGITDADIGVLNCYGLQPGKYVLLIARAEPENSILEIVRAWSCRPRGIKLVVLGKYEPGHAYQDTVKMFASHEVLFLGAVYEKGVVDALRFYARFYVHGHQVGGTNPSLVEALGAGNAVLAHDNPYNRWVAGEGGMYFSNEDECSELMDLLLVDEACLIRMRAASRSRHVEQFTWDHVLEEYEKLLLRFAGEGALGKWQMG
jgi:glycosyltransferase involved in cell wall biosynthesis